MRGVLHFAAGLGMALVIAGSFGAAPALAASIEEQLLAFAESPHLELLETRREPVEDHVVGLGAMKKVRGTWGMKDSERVSGMLTVYTWRVLDGFTAAELMDELESQLALDEDTAQRSLFRCDGRACGNGAQWATRVFGQRILYGRSDWQQYRAYRVEGDENRLVIYSAARSSDRQYLHVELVQVAPEEPIDSAP